MLVYNYKLARDKILQGVNHMEYTSIGIMERRFLNIIWENEPITSMDLVKLCSEQLNWHRSTTYTTLRHLQEKGLVKNEETVVTSLYSKDEVQAMTSENIVSEAFSGSLPSFITAFFRGKTITSEEAEKLKKLIDSYKE